MPVSSVSEAMVALGRPANESPRQSIVHGKNGTLIAIGVPDSGASVDWVGVLVSQGEVSFLGPSPPPNGPSAAHGLTGNSGRLFDLFVSAGHRYLERFEEIDERLAEAQRRGRQVPLSHVWGMQRDTAFVRAHLGRAVVALIECEGLLSDSFPGFAANSQPIEGELERARNFGATVQQSLSDLILLRNAEESNRIAEAANELSRTSNRIATLANISNIRMLGLTYIALVLGLISAVVLIPNTAATILGMPSAGWVPGIWVDVSLVVLAAVPLAIVFTRPWVRRILSGLRADQARAIEGLSDLPEQIPEPSTATR